MYSSAILDHFEHPRNVGELAPPAITVEASNPVCGDILRLSLLVDGGVIRESAFKAKGCVASIAAGSALTEMVKGKSKADAAGISPDELALTLGGLPPESGHAAELAVEALKRALEVGTH